MISLRQLRYFDALARHRHFGRAAQECAISQPALSMQIKELERELGAELFERRSGDIALTAIGAEIVERGERILSSVDDLTEIARHRGRLLSGPLRLGVIPSLAPYLLPKILPKLQSKYPDLQLELRESQTKALVAELSRGSLDAILAALPLNMPEIQSVALFDDPFLLATPSIDPLPPQTFITVDDIDASRLILLEDGHCLRDQALAVCSSTRLPLREFGATSLTTVMQLIANGYGVTLLPKIAADVEARDERVRLVEFAAPQPGRTIGMMWRKTSSRAKDFAALGDLISETVTGQRV